MQRADDVVVLLSGAIVEERLARERLAHRLQIHLPAAVLGWRGHHRHLEDIQGGAGVTVRGLGEEFERIVRHVRAGGAEAALRVGEGPPKHVDELGGPERFQDHDAAA